MTVAAAAGPLVEDFEEPEVSRSRWLPSGPQPAGAVSTNRVPAFSGQRCLQITVLPGDNRMIGRQGNPTERFELTLREPQLKFGQETWYAFALRVPANFPRGKNRTVIHQFKENTRPIPQDWPAGLPHCQKASPMFALYLEDGRKLLALATSSQNCDHTRHLLGEKTLEPDRWYEITVHARPAHDASGWIEIYCDGERLGRYSGVTGYVCHGLGYIDTQPRFGIYRDARADIGAATIYYDALRFAPTREGLRR